MNFRKAHENGLKKLRNLMPVTCNIITKEDEYILPVTTAKDKVDAVYNNKLSNKKRVLFRFLKTDLINSVGEIGEKNNCPVTYDELSKCKIKYKGQLYEIEDSKNSGIFNTTIEVFGNIFNG